METHLVRGERGQSIVEFALIFLPFIFLVFAVFDGGVLMGRYNDVNHAAKEGARYGATGAGALQVADRVRDQAPGGLLDSLPLACSGDEYICVQYIDGPDREPAGEVGSGVKVTVKYRYNPQTPLANNVPGGFFEVSSCAVARLERPPTTPVTGSGSVGC